MPGGSSSSDGPDATWRGFLARVPARLAARWRFKALLALVIGTVFTTAYLLLGHYPPLPPRELPLTGLDRAIGFYPYRWVWAYQSAYLLINAVPWLATTREDLVRYAKGFALLSLMSFAVFIVFPVRAPTPVVEDPRGMYWLLKHYDAPNNALPSLHVGLVVYTLLFGRRIFAGNLPRGLGAACVAWALLIAYSTLATKEHYVVDLPAGAALAVVAHWWAWRCRDTSVAAMSSRGTPRDLGVAVH